MPTTKPPYPAEFKQQMVELVRAGRTPAELGREFKCSAQSIATWVARDAADKRAPQRASRVREPRTERWLRISGHRSRGFQANVVDVSDERSRRFKRS